MLGVPWARRRSRESSPRRRWRGRWRRCWPAASRSCRRSTSPRDRSATGTSPRSSTRCAQRVREGQSLAATMRARPMFPDVAVKMTEVGESTGALQDMLNSLADFYDEDLDDEPRAVRDARRAGAPHHSGHRHREPAARALPAALPAFFGSALMDVALEHARARPAADRRREPTPTRPNTRPKRAAVLAERYRLEFVDMDAFPDRRRAVPLDSRRADAALRLRAAIAAKARRSSSSCRTRATCR